MNPKDVRNGLIGPQEIQDRFGMSPDHVQQLIDLVAGWYDRAITGFNDPDLQESSWQTMLWCLMQYPENIPLLNGNAAEHPTLGRATLALRLNGFSSSYGSLADAHEEVRRIWRSQVLVRTVFQLVQFCNKDLQQPGWYETVVIELSDPMREELTDLSARVIAGLRLSCVEVYVVCVVLPMVLAGRFSEQ